MLPGLGIFFEAAVVVEVVLVVELLQLFGMACAVWVDSANFAEKMPRCTLPFWGFYNIDLLISYKVHQSLSKGTHLTAFALIVYGR